MRNSYIPVIAFLLFLAGCYPPPEYPDTPEIGFNDITFYDNAAGTDSLVLSLEFQDGNGDLGLLATENEFPYNPLTYLLDENNDFIEKGSSPDLPEDNCLNYAPVTIEGETKEVLVMPNPNFYNIEVDFYVLENGEYEFFDIIRFREDQCGLNFYGRFPPLVADDDLGEGPIEGILNYRMKSSGFIGYFSANDSLKLRVLIRDRALNESNEIFTPAFTLNSIRR